MYRGFNAPFPLGPTNYGITYKQTDRQPPTSHLDVQMTSDADFDDDDDMVFQSYAITQMTMIWGVKTTTKEG